MTVRRVAEVQARLRGMADAEQAAVARRFFKTAPGEYGEGDRFLGIRVPRLRALARELRDLTLDDALALLASPYHEARLVALLMMVERFRRGDEAERRRIYRAYLANTDRVNNWDLVDLSAHHIVGGYLETRSRTPLRRLARSKSLWERRIAMIATFQFIRTNDFDDALAVAGMLVDDEEDLIHKAVGWMLREVGKRNQGMEEKFLRAHCRTMPRTMLRYAIERFPEERRQRYLRAR